MSCCQGLFHTVLQARQFSHRVITTKEKQQKREELGSVHSARYNLLLAEENKKDHEHYADHLYCRRREARNFCCPQVGANNAFGHFREAKRFVRFGTICLNDSLI